MVAASVVLGGGLATTPSAADQRTPRPAATGQPATHPDGASNALRPRDAAELARAVGADTGDRAMRSTMATGRVQARSATASPSNGPDFEMPFSCGTSWTGATRSGHSPSYYATDFNAPDDLGKPIVAPAAGTVTLVRSLTYSYGKYVVIDHGDGYTTLYAHMNALAVSVGQRVDQGDLVGFVGTSGNSTGPHLHFEMRRNGSFVQPYYTRTSWRYGTTAASNNCGDRPVAGDWDGDGSDEVGVYKPRARTSHFRLRDRSGTKSNLPWATAGSTPVLGDYDGDGTTQVGAKLLGSTTWQLRSRTGAVATASRIGGAYDAPLAGDWNGDGRAELGWYRWANRTFYLRWPDYSVRAIALGATGETPVVGDWNGDGTDEVGTFNSLTRVWTLRSTTGNRATTQRVTFGAAGDLPVVGDWNGDDVTDLGTWRPSTAQFSQRVVTGNNARTTVIAHGLKRG